MQIDPLVSADEPRIAVLGRGVGTCAHRRLRAARETRAANAWQPVAVVRSCSRLAALASRASLSPYIAVMAVMGLNMIHDFLFMTHVVFAKEQAR